MQIRWSIRSKALEANAVVVEVEEVQPDRHASVVTHMKAERHKSALDPSDCSVRFGPKYYFGRLNCMKNTPVVVAE